MRVNVVTVAITVTVLLALQRVTVLLATYYTSAGPVECTQWVHGETFLGDIADVDAVMEAARKVVR